MIAASPGWQAVRKVLRKPQFWFGVVWTMPILAWYAFFSYGPVLRAFSMTTLNYNIVNPELSPFVGLDNFRSLFANRLFWTGIRNTLLWALFCYAGLLPLALILSVGLSRLRRGRNTYQAIAFLPVVVSLPAVCLLFLMVLDPQIGPVNRLLESIGLPTSKFLTNSSSALPTAAAVGIWKSVGFHVVILTAGLMAIPEEFYDAARVDGANEWQRFWRVTLPLLSNTLLLETVIIAIGSLQEFGIPYVLTRGGPGDATLMYNLFLYNEAFTNMRFGTATGAALLQFAVILVISIGQIKLLRPKWSY